MSFEPIFMDNPDYDRLVKIVYASYPNACILMLDRIVNPELQARYEAARAAMGADANEKQVYHGSRSGAIAAIAQEGFKAQLNRTSAYGLGSYFARDFAYSRNYSNTDANGVSNMFFCNILAGKVCQSDPNQAIPAAFDTGVDNVKRPSIYVVRDDAKALPVYLVRFHKTAV